MATIQDIRIKHLKVIQDERGWLMEILRNDDEIFQDFGQVYITTAYPGVVKAWHYHKKQTDNFTCIHGTMKVVLYDNRKDSSTYRTVNEFFIGERSPTLISVPPGIYHGFKAVGIDTAMFLNIPTHVYDYDQPDEFRLPPDDPEVGYDWLLDDTKKNG